MPPFVLVLCSVAVFVDPVCGKITLGPFAMAAARAVERLIAGVVEAAFAGLDLGLTVQFGASGRTANRDPLGIGFEPASHRRCSFRLCPLPLLRQGVLRLLSHRRELFSAQPSHPKLEGPRVDSGMREAERCMDVTNAVVGESRWRGRAGGARATAYRVVE